MRAAVDALADRLPPDAFSAVVATGVVSVAARDTGHRALAQPLGWLAILMFAVQVVLALWRLRRCGRAFADKPGRIDHECGRYTLVAACGVLGTRFGTGSSVVDAGFGLAALAAWLLTFPLVVRAVRASVGRLLSGARGDWLLASVGTQSVAITAAVFVYDTGSPALLPVSTALWLLGLCVYVVITGMVIARAVTRPLFPRDLAPDMWVLMGALAIATLAGSKLIKAGRVVHADGWVIALVEEVSLGTWILATGWIPVLVLCEARRLIAGLMLEYEHTRWSTVFPIGMYASASSALGVSGLLPAFAMLVPVAFWCGFAAWCAMAAGWLLRLRK